MEKNIYQRIAQVQRAVSKVAKDTTVQAGGQTYRAVSHDAVLSVIRESVVEAGIIVSPSQIGKGDIVPGETKSGGYKHRFEALYRVDFINIDNPEDRHTVVLEAHADDNGDKAPGKAISYATKTAELKVFLLATGENDEERMEEGHYGKRPQPKTQPTQTSSADREAINARIVAALRAYGCKTVREAEVAVKQFSAMPASDKYPAREGVTDYHKLTDGQAKVLADKLEKAVKEKAAETPELCNECRQPLSGGKCLNESCPECDPF